MIKHLFYRNIREEATLKILAKLIFEFLRLIFRSKQDIVLEGINKDADGICLNRTGRGKLSSTGQRTISQCVIL